VCYNKDTEGDKIKNKKEIIKMGYSLYMNGVYVRTVYGDEAAGNAYVDLCEVADLFKCGAAICDAATNEVIDYHKN
jgi:hypothetical protein